MDDFDLLLAELTDDPYAWRAYEQGYLFTQFHRALAWAAGVGAVGAGLYLADGFWAWAVPVALAPLTGVAYDATHGVPRRIADDAPSGTADLRYTRISPLIA